MIKHVIFILILAISLSALAMPAGATTYYVATNGKDTNDGSSGSPFRTIQKGVDRAGAGDTVHINAGTYYERISFSTDGSSGNPITIEGESDGSTIVDGSDAVTAGSWSHIGNNVYQQASYAYEPGSLYVVEDGDTIDIPRCRQSNCSTYIAYASDRTLVTPKYLSKTINWWDGIEAMFRHSGSTLYVRFADNSNPQSMTIRTSPESGEVFDLSGDSWITLKNLTIRGAHRGIEINGSGSHDIVIDNCTLYAIGRERIRIITNAYNIEIKNCTIYGGEAWDLGSYKPGPWLNSETGANVPMSQAIAYWIYYAYKYYFSTDSTSANESWGIAYSGIGSGISVHDCTIYDHLSNLSGFCCGGETIDIYNNTMYNGEQNVYLAEGTAANVYNNTLYNAQMNIRFGKTDLYSGRGPYNIYNNKFWNPEIIGDHIYFHTTSSTSPVSGYADYNIYHNSFSGGYRTWKTTSQAYAQGGQKAAVWVNNIFSGGTTILFGLGGQSFWSNSTMYDVFNYNWVGGTYSYSGDPAWSSTQGNVYAEDEQVWDDSSMPDFILPAESSARESGIDLSVNFNINGKTYPPLLGMEPGYYENEKPNMGFDFPNPPKNFRNVLN